MNHANERATQKVAQLLVLVWRCDILPRLVWFLCSNNKVMELEKLRFRISQPFPWQCQRSVHAAPLSGCEWHRGKRDSDTGCPVDWCWKSFCWNIQVVQLYRRCLWVKKLVTLTPEDLALPPGSRGKLTAITLGPHYPRWPSLSAASLSVLCCYTK